MRRRISLAKVPLRAKPKYAAEASALAKRIVGLLPRLDFLGRDKIIFNMRGGNQLSAYIEVKDTLTGSVMMISHAKPFSDDMSDWDIARQIYIMVCQMAVHEAAENFRLDGQIMFNPHNNGRNEILFKAVELSGSETPEQDIKHQLAAMMTAIPKPQPPGPPPNEHQSRWRRLCNWVNSTLDKLFS